MKISFCTTCMGRLHHLQLTLPQNIRWAKGHDVEFILVDYNSQDGLHEWVHENLTDELQSGLVKYFRTETPTRFHPAHAKNIAHLKATGHYLVNLDADNFLGDGFLKWMKLHISDNRIIRSWPNGDGTYGRIGLTRKRFMELGGYDESSFQGYSYEDCDLLNRAIAKGIRPVMFPEKYCLFLPHSNAERIKHMDTNWEVCNRVNKEVGEQKIRDRKLVANVGRNWGVMD